MESQVAVVNTALIMIGSDEIIDIDEDSTPARKAKALWAGTRDAVMRTHPWKCCLARASLAMATATPAWGYSYQFQLPTDPYCLRVLRMQDLGQTYTVNGRMLLTDWSEANILYIARVTDVASWDALLKETIAARLAADLAYPIAGSSKLADSMLALYERKLREARSINAMEGTPDEFEVSEWVDSRL